MGRGAAVVGDVSAIDKLVRGLATNATVVLWIILVRPHTIPHTPFGVTIGTKTIVLVVSTSMCSIVGPAGGVSASPSKHASLHQWVLL